MVVLCVSGLSFFFREGYAIRYNAQFGLREILSG